MNDSRNLIIAIAFSLAILIGWNLFYEKPRLEAERTRQAEQKKQTENKPNILQNSEELGIFTESVALPQPANRQQILRKNQRIQFNNNRIKASMNLQGALFDDLILRDYYETIDNKQNIVLLEPKGVEKPYFAEFGWIGKNTQFPNRDTIWQTDNIKSKPNNIILFWQNQDNVRFEKHISLDENYLFTVNLNIKNNSKQTIDLAPYGLISRTGHPSTLGFYILHEGLIGVIDDSLEEVDYDDVIDSQYKPIDTKGGWIGITDKYWLAAIIPDQNSNVTMQFQGKKNKPNNLFQSQFVTSLQTLQPNQTHQYTSYLYAGAKETTLLDAYEKKYNINNFDLAVDFGWFYFLTKPFYKAIHHLNNYLGNFGLAILALTVLVKLVLLPLAYKSYASMSKMKLLQPQVMLLKEQYQDDKDGLRQAMMDLYKQQNVNPMSGCLPILLQIPIFFSLYKVLFVTIEMRHAPFYGWIYDLSAPDPLGLLTAFGLINWQVPNIISVANIGLWPIIMGVTMWLQQKMNPTPPDPIQAKIFALMPFLFTFLLATFPAGLVIYWAWNNTLSIAQQWFVMRLVSRSAESMPIPMPSTAKKAKAKVKAKAKAKPQAQATLSDKSLAQNQKANPATINKKKHKKRNKAKRR